MSSGQEVGQIFGEGSGPATALLRSPIVLIASIVLWGMNVQLFRLFRIDYIRVLTGKGSSTPPPDDEVDRKDEEEIYFGKNKGQVELAPTASGRHTKEKESSPASNPTSSAKIYAKEVSSDDERDPITPPSYSSNSEVTARKLYLLALLLFLLLQLNTYFWITVMGRSIMGAIFVYYSSVAVLFFLPIPSTRWIRVCVKTVLVRALELIKPRCYFFNCQKLMPVPFIDVFFADAMCSLSKVFFDWGLLWHMAAHYPDPVPAEIESIIIPSAAAALPYLIRARQCIVMHTYGKIKNDPKRYQHLLNALKYSTSLFPICLSAYQKTVSKEESDFLESYLLALLTINSLYAFYWDVVMDWGMMYNPTAVLEQTCAPSTPAIPGTATMKPTDNTLKPNTATAGCAHACLRPKLRFGCGLSTLILVSDFALRFTWLLRFYERILFPSVDVYILTTELLEVFRRAIWNLLRVEWEKIKTTPTKVQINKDDERLAFLGPIEMTPMHTA